MTGLDALKALKSFLQVNIADKALLQREDTMPAEYVHPYVEIMYLPHKNFSPRDFQVPLILIGLDNAVDDAQDNMLNLRLTFSTYGGGFYKDEDGNNTTIPDAQGYIDLINIIEKTKLELATAGIIDGQGTIIKPFIWGTYDAEMAYPYFYGYLAFGVNIPATEFITGSEENPYGI